MSQILDIAMNAKDAAISALQLSTDIKNNALLKIAELIEANKLKIFEANNLDLALAKNELDNGQMSVSMFNRLKIDDNKVRDMVQGVRDIANLLVLNRLYPR